MTFYHGTTQQRWEEIQKEGVLFGVKRHMNENGDIVDRTDVRRQTYLAVDQSEAEHYGQIILQVEYDPYDEHGEIRKNDKGRKLNTYDPTKWVKREDGRWEHRHFIVYEPIDIKNVKQIEKTRRNL